MAYLCLLLVFIFDHSKYQSVRNCILYTGVNLELAAMDMKNYRKLRYESNTFSANTPWLKRSLYSLRIRTFIESLVKTNSEIQGDFKELNKLKPFVRNTIVRLHMEDMLSRVKHLDDIVTNMKLIYKPEEMVVDPSTLEVN